MNPDMEIIKSLNTTDVIGVDTLGSDFEKQFEEISRKHENPVDVWNFYDIILLVLKKYPNSCINMHLLHNWREVRCELCQM